MEMLSDELIGRIATTGGGHKIGRIEDIVFDTSTGEMKYLLVRPEDDLQVGRVDARGRTVVAFTSLDVHETYVIFT